MKKIENKGDIEGRDVRICVGLRARRANQEEEARSRIWKRPRARLATTTAEKNALGIEIVIADEKRRVGGMEEEMPVNGNHWQPEERPSIDPSFIEARSTPISPPLFYPLPRPASSRSQNLTLPREFTRFYDFDCSTFKLSGEPLDRRTISKETPGKSKEKDSLKFPI